MTRLLRRFNYTKRVRLLGSEIHIDVESNGGGHCKAVLRRIDLSNRGSHSVEEWDAAKVVLEARRMSTGSYCSKELGTVAAIKAATSVIEFDLPDFGDDADITFRAKVVGPTKRLLGEVDGLRLGEPKPTDRDPLIYLVLDDLKEELWRVDWADPDGPRVLVNKRIPNCSGVLTRDPLVRALVLPHIIREVLTKAVAAEGAEPWVEKWLEFASKMGQDEPPEADSDDDDVAKWVNLVVASFAARSNFATLTEQFLSRADSDHG